MIEEQSTTDLENSFSTVTAVKLTIYLLLIKEKHTHKLMIKQEQNNLLITSLGELEN